LRGRLRVPGDKSISHRAVILGALASGRSAIHGLNLGADVRATARLVEALGASILMGDGALVEVESLGRWRLREPDAVLDAGNSATTLRMMLGVCAGIEGFSVLTGDASLRRRPMLRVVSPLKKMGARIDGRVGGDLAPLAVRGGKLAGIDFNSTIASAQVKTCVLLAGLFAEGSTSVSEPSQSRDHTERMLEASGVAVRRHGLTVGIAGAADIAPTEWHIPGDPSAAMFLVVAAALVPGSDLVIVDLALNPTRTRGLEVLRRMGANIEIEATGEMNGEPVGNLRARASELTATAVGPEDVVACIDEIPALAVAAARAQGETVVTGASELRVKESDRISALVGGLRVLGVDATELPDGFVVRGPAELGGGTVESFGDHRIAMALAVAGLTARDAVTVRDRGCIETSFPGFDEALNSARAGP
jgi:3-phosphoshikimate 1-carboxyvinyltransferase